MFLVIRCVSDNRITDMLIYSQSDAAAGRGFAELWDALELGSVGELDVE
jgi:hypothetical protein